MLRLKLTVTAIVLLLLSSNCAQSQTEVDTTYATQVNAIFSTLEKNRVPYGILRDYGMEFISLITLTAPLHWQIVY